MCLDSYPQDPYGRNMGCDIYSAESSNQPRLSVTYTIEPQCNTDADKTPYGNCDGVLDCIELNNYIQGYYLNNENIENTSDIIRRYILNPACS